MVVVSILFHAESRPNDARHFILTQKFRDGEIFFMIPSSNIDIRFKRFISIIYGLESWSRHLCTTALQSKTSIVGNPSSNFLIQHRF